MIDERPPIESPRQTAGSEGVSASHEGPRPRWAGPLLLVLLIGVVARVFVLSAWSENLSDDRDAYLVLAQGIAEGRGLSVPGSERPTAYRPPLYPLLLAPFSSPDAVLWRAVLHLVLGVLTVGLTCRLGQLLGLGWTSFAAGALVAVDPLLLRYTTFPMTETLATLLVTAFLLSVVTSGPASSVARQAGSGVLFGLCALCRPTVWAWAGLMLVLMAGRRCFRRCEPPTPQQVSWWSVVGAALVVAPWVLRNLAQLGHPVLTTTHGGYTLLLGNNPEFYREVVTQPWGTVWDGSHGGGQSAWVESLNRLMDEQGVEGEVARDRWMGRRAREHISAQPLMFARACLLRFTRFWSVVPTGVEGDRLSGTVRWLVGSFYVLMFVGALRGLGRVVHVSARRWGPCLLMLAAFVGVHLVYWTNARMRAPVSPVIALLCAAGMTSLSRRRDGWCSRDITP